MKSVVYLDWNSTGLVSQSILDSINFSYNSFRNPFSTHSEGQHSYMLLKKTLQELEVILEAQEYDFFFTSSATEANFLVTRLCDQTYVSDLEHPSLREIAEVEIIKVDQNGKLNLSQLESIISKSKKPFLVSYMLANHETGIINDLTPVIELTKRYGGYFHTDASQAFGRIGLSLKQLEVDYMTICAHKCGGPIGIGALVYRKSLGLPRHLARKSTPAIPLIVGMTKSAKLMKNDNKVFEQLIANRVKIIGDSLNRLPNTTCIRCDNKSELLPLLDFRGIIASSASACTSNLSKPHSITAMGLDFDTIRFSSGFSTTQDQFTTAAEIFLSLI